jgi:hypothetical protein
MICEICDILLYFCHFLLLIFDGKVGVKLLLHEIVHQSGYCKHRVTWVSTYTVPSPLPMRGLDFP